MTFQFRRCRPCFNAEFFKSAAQQLFVGSVAGMTMPPSDQSNLTAVFKTRCLFHFISYWLSFKVCTERVNNVYSKLCCFCAIYPSPFAPAKLKGQFFCKVNPTQKSAVSWEKWSSRCRPYTYARFISRYLCGQQKTQKCSIWISLPSDSVTSPKEQLVSTVKIRIIGAHT